MDNKIVQITMSNDRIFALYNDGKIYSSSTQWPELQWSEVNLPNRLEGF